jgi:hypothetical protein
LNKYNEYYAENPFHTPNNNKEVYVALHC